MLLIHKGRAINSTTKVFGWFYSSKLMLLIFCYSYCVMFLQSLYFPTSARRNTAQLTLITTPTCFGTQMPSSGIYYNKGVQAKITKYICWKMYWAVLSVLNNELFVCVCVCVCGFTGGIGCRDICSCGKTGSNQGNDLQNWAHLNSSLIHAEMFLFAKWHSVTTLHLFWHITNLNERTGSDEFLRLCICMPLSIITGHDLWVFCVLPAYLWMSYCFHA